MQGGFVRQGMPQSALHADGVLAFKSINDK